MRFSWALTGLLSCLSLFTPDFVSSQASTSYGLDLQVTIPISAFECLKKEGYSYVISRAWKSTGVFDEGSVKTLSNALAAGFDTLDISFIPCPKCEQSGPEQIKTMMDKLKNHKFGSLWIDIEDGANWPKDQDANREFLNGIVNAAIEAVGQERVGIYAVKQYYETLFGKDYDDHKSLPLWTAGFDKRDNFDDWKPFGGWCQPLMKQYDGNVQVCNVHINKNIGKPVSSKTGRWATTCWSKCDGEEQRRKVTCVKGGKDVDESHCRSTRPSAKRSCPFTTPTCSSAGGKCVHRKQCKRYARMGEATCANAPSNVCCDPNAQEPESEEEKPAKSKPKTKKSKAKKPKPQAQAQAQAETEAESEPEATEETDNVFSCRVGIKAGTCITQDACDAKSGQSKNGKGYCPKSAGDVVCCYNIKKTTSSSEEENDDTSDEPKPKPIPKLKVPHAPKNVGYEICHTDQGTGVCYPEKDCTRDVDLAVQGYCDRKGQTCCMRRN